MANVLVTYGVPDAGFLEALPGCALHIPPTGRRFAEDELFRLLPAMDAAVACTPFTGEMIRAAKRLRIIVCYGAGYDSIDIAAATERGVPVCNIPDTVTAPTAELAIALMTSLARRIPFLNEAMRREAPSGLFVMGKNMGASLEGATLGVVGMGRIGGKVADFGRLMGMRVLYTARHEQAGRPYARRVSLPVLMREADFVSVHCPLTPETRGMINREMLGLLKPTAYVINTARGAVIEEDALLSALQARAIAGAALDVFPGEPNVNPAFLALPNVILTPHVGSNTDSARRLMAREAGARIAAALRGETPQNLLNPSITA